jgi:hypothetical protein
MTAQRKDKMRLSNLFPLVFGSCWFLALGIVGAQAQSDVTVAGNNRTVNLEGQGRDFTLAGNHDEVRIGGETRSIRILGNQNTVRLERVDEINVIGAQNRISYQGAVTKDAPSVSQSGAQNRIGIADAGAPAEAGSKGSSGESDQASGSLVLTGDDLDVSRNVSGAQVHVVGDRNHVNLSGSVDELLVTGDHNSIGVDKVARVRFLGDYNTVVYKSVGDGAKPEAGSLGEHNSIRSAD